MLQQAIRRPREELIIAQANRRLGDVPHIRVERRAIDPATITIAVGAAVLLLAGTVLA